MGNMKAKDVAIVVGSVRYKGFTFKVTAYDKAKLLFSNLRVNRICRTIFLNDSRKIE